MAGAACEFEGFPFLEGSVEADRVAIARFSRTVSIARGEVLFRAGEPARGAYLLRTGAVKLTCRRPPAPERVLDVYEPGESFGESAVFARSGHVATAVATAPSELLCIDAGELVRFLPERPELALRMITELAERKHRVLERLELLGARSAEQRIAGYLLERCGGRASSCAAHLTRRDLASLLGLTPETLSRTLAGLRAKGLIDSGRHRIRVLEPTGLRELLDTPP